jgi:hypothetical protein
MRTMKLAVVLLQAGWLVACGGGSSGRSEGFTSLSGTWLMSSHCTDGCELLTFFPGGTGVYGLYWPGHPTEPGVGVQRFTYTWDSTSHLFEVTGVQLDTTGDWNGFVTEPPSTVLTPTGANSAHVEGAGDLDRLTSSASDPLQGTWYLGEPSSGTWAEVVFLPDGHYLFMGEAPADEAGQAGIEFGSYAWDPATGALSVAVAPDGNTDGDWGFSAAGSVTIAVGGATASLSVDGGPGQTLHRLEPAP